MKQLAGLDASFLHLETPQMPMLVGGLHNFELPADEAGDFTADTRCHMAARLPFAPALCQTVAKMPLNFSNPNWIDALADLQAHIVGIELPAGSGQIELEHQVGRLHTVLLDSSRPLWKFHVFSGLATGPAGRERHAMYTQLHHAAVDGQAAVALGQAILHLSPVPRQLPTTAKQAAAQAKVRRQLGLADMLRAALSNQLGLVVTAVKSIPQAEGMLSRLAAQKDGGTAGDAYQRIKAAESRLQGHAARSSATRRVCSRALAPRTRLNTTVSDTRAFASLSLPLAQFNAVRRNFLTHGPLPCKSMVAGGPVATRSKGDTASNNQATMTLVSLGTHIADPAQRLRHVRAAFEEFAALPAKVEGVAVEKVAAVKAPMASSAAKGGQPRG